MPTQNHERAPDLRDLYPGLDGQELASAAETFDRYVNLVARMAERIAGDPEALARFRSLTAPDGDRTMKADSSIPPGQ